MLCRHETLSGAILEERGIGLGPVTKRRCGEWEECFSLSSPRLPPLARFVDPQPGPDLAARIEDGDLITNSGFFDHPTTCVQARKQSNAYGASSKVRLSQLRLEQTQTHLCKTDILELFSLIVAQFGISGGLRPCLQAGRVTLARGSKISRVYKQNFTGRVTLPPGTTSCAW